MAIYYYIAMSVISYALTVYMAPDQPSPSPAKIGDINVNTAEEGLPIPVIFGKPWITAANCVWYGDLRTEAIKSKGGKK